MEHRFFGRSGLEVSAVGLGCNNFGTRCDEKQTKAVVDAALDAGIDFFDTADIYGDGASETLLGRALGKRRKEVVIATKFGGRSLADPIKPGGGSMRWIRRAVEASLERLGTDYIDLYQLHFPDDATPQKETLRALDDLISSGKVRYIGCSNFAGWQIADAIWISRRRGFAPYVSAQNRYNLLDRRVEREVLPASRHFGLGFLPYFPLASGFLTGKYERGTEPPAGTRMAQMSRIAEATLTEANFDRLEALVAFASERGHSVLELAMGWLASREAVTSVIAGATRPDQVKANVAAIEWKLSDEDLAEVDRLTRRRSAG